MNFVRQILAVFLSVYLSSPVWAAENPGKKVGGKEYPYFKLGVRPMDESQFVDWEKECTVVSNEDSVPIRLQYKSAVGGKVRVSIFGIIRPGEEIVVDKVTKRALRVRKCGNGIVQPTDWVPTGELRCLPSAVPEKPVVSAEETPKVVEPEPAKKLNLKLDDPAPAPRPVATKVADKPKPGKKSKTWLYILGGALVGGVIVGLAGGGSKKSSGGGPAPDPRN